MPGTLRLTDTRFLLAWLLPGLTLVGIAEHPSHAAFNAFVIWAMVALIDAFLPGADRSPAAAPAHPLLAWILRLYVPLQLTILAAGLMAAAHSSWPTVLALGFAVGFGLS